MFVTMILCVAVVWVMDALWLNWFDVDRSKHCLCLKNARIRGLWGRCCDFHKFADYCVADPNRDSISACAAAFGTVLGWFFLKRAYIRVPLDVYYFDFLDENQYLHECVRPSSCLVPDPRSAARAGTSQKMICPSLAATCSRR